MMKRTKLNPRKVLLATAGLATINYISASGCAGEATVANLVVGPGAVGGAGGAPVLGGGSGNGGSPPYVANLVAPPPSGSGGALVANLVAPPPGGSPNEPNESSDASTDAPALDASPDDGGAVDSGNAG